MLGRILPLMLLIVHGCAVHGDDWRDTSLPMPERVAAFDRELDHVAGMTEEALCRRFPVDTSSRISEDEDVRSYHLTAPDGSDRFILVVNGVAE